MKDINSIKLSSHGDRIYADSELIGSVHFSESAFIDEKRREGESWIAMRDRTADARLKLGEKATQYASMFAAAPELFGLLKLFVEKYEQGFVLNESEIGECKSVLNKALDQ